MCIDHPTCIRVQIRITHLRKLCLDGFQGRLCHRFQACIRSPARFGVESHARIVGSPRVVFFGVCSGAVPGQTNKGSVQGGSVTAFLRIALNHIHNGFTYFGEIDGFLGMTSVRLEKDCKGCWASKALKRFAKRKRCVEFDRSGFRIES